MLKLVTFVQVARIRCAGARRDRRWRSTAWFLP